MSEYFQDLQDKIAASYEGGITMDEAEKLAGEFLHAQMLVASKLRKADLDSRMRKSGFKAVSAAVYMEAATKSDKKPSDTYLQNLVDLNELVKTERDGYNEAEVDVAYYQNLLNIFNNAHVHFRTIAKGRFE